MREIKFRAVIKNIKNIDGTLYDKIVGQDFFWFYGIGFPFSKANYEYELMQYTGLKDKNDVEIYEGDILNTPYYRNVQVLYSLHSGGFIFHPTDRNAMCSPSERINNDLFHMNYSKDVEEIVNYFNEDKNGEYFIIGNIYENPELLKGLNDKH